MKKESIVIILLAVCFVFNACKKDEVEDNNDSKPATCMSTETIKFSTNVLPLMQKNCFACHDSNGGTVPLLKDHETIAANASSILATVRGDAGFTRMPSGGPFWSDSLVNDVSCWVSQGKLDN